MKHNPTHIGQVESVSGNSVTIKMASNYPSNMPIVDGTVYRIGQIGSFLKIPLGYANLYGLITQAGVLAMPESLLTVIEPDGRLRMALVLQFGEPPDYLPREGWLKTLGVKGPISGKAKISWEGSGQVEDFSIFGGGTVSVESFKMADMKEFASLNLKTSHSGRRADLSVLEASMGDLKISAPGAVIRTWP